MLPLNQLAQFVSIVRTGSLTAAAQELDVSAAALSKSLASLERQLGTSLFDRVGRGLQLSRTGEIFAAQSAELLGHAEALKRQFQTTVDGSAGHLAIGCGPAALQAPISQVVNQCLSEHPGVTLEIHTGSTSNLLKGLRQYRYDFLVTDAGNLASGAETAGYASRVLPSEQVILVARRGHPLAARQDVSLSEALDYPWITPSIPAGMRKALEAQLRTQKAPAEAFARLATLPDVRIEDLNSCVQIAVGGHGIAPALASTIAGGGLPRSVAALPVTIDVSTRIAIVTLEQRTPSPLADRVMATMLALPQPDEARGAATS